MKFYECYEHETSHRIKVKQGVQELQVFAFCVVTVND